MSHYRRDVVGRGISTGLGLGLRRRISGAGLPILFTWSPVDGETLPSGTFTRASVAEEYDGTDFTQVSSGTIREGSAAAAAGAQGYLPEPAATNNVLQSNNYSSGAWSKNGLTFSSQGVVSIGLEAIRLDTGVSLQSHRMFQSPVGATTVHTVPVIAKAITGQYLGVRTENDGNAYSIFDLVNGTRTENGSAVDSSRITLISDDWYSCEVTASNGLGGALVVAISDSGTPGSANPTFTGANETIDICNVGREDTAFATSPIITSGSTVTRVADVLDTDQTIASAFGALLDVTLPSVIASGATISLLGPDATAEDIIRVDASGNVVMDDGGTPVTIGTATLGTRIKVSYGRDGTGRSGSLDGATVATGGAPGAGHEGDTFQIGAANSVNQSRCIHHNTVIYAERPTDDQLEALSS